MNAFEFSHVEKHYPGFSLNLDLSLPEGCILGLLGENGAGKSTSIQMLLGMRAPDAGSIRVLDKPVDKDFAPVREDIGVVLDEPGFPECLTPAQLGKVMAGVFRHWDAGTYETLLKRLSLERDKPYKSFSRGMKMKLAIAVAMSHRARLLVLDEPCSGLDPIARDEVVELLTDFTREEGRSVLISSHIVSDLEKLCDYVAFLHRGRLLLYEEKDRLLDRYGLALCTKEQLETLPVTTIAGKQENLFGVTVLIKKEDAPEDLGLIPVSLEELFVTMIKEADA